MQCSRTVQARGQQAPVQRCAGRRVGGTSRRVVAFVAARSSNGSSEQQQGGCGLRGCWVVVRHRMDCSSEAAHRVPLLNPVLYPSHHHHQKKSRHLPAVNRRQTLLSAAAAAALLPQLPQLLLAPPARAADGLKAFEDRTLAYAFSYPVATASGQPLSLVLTRPPEKYSSAAPLSADARQRIVSELFDLRKCVRLGLCFGAWGSGLAVDRSWCMRCGMRRLPIHPTARIPLLKTPAPPPCGLRFVTVSMTVGPASGALKDRPQSDWTAKEVALTVLIDRWAFGCCGLWASCVAA